MVFLYFYCFQKKGIIMNILKDMKPGSVWEYFEEICKIPRLSKNEDRIREYLLEFASANKLEAREDKSGNILIIRPPSEGMEKKRTLVLCTLRWLQQSKRRR